MPINTSQREGAALRLTFVSYTMNRISVISHLRCLRHHLRHGVKRVTGFSGHCVPLQIQFPCHPAVRWDYNPPRSNHLISISRRSAARISPSGGDAATGGRRGAFPSPARAVVRFYISRNEIIYSPPRSGNTFPSARRAVAPFYTTCRRRRP